MPDLTTHAVLEHNFLFRGLPDSSLDVLAKLARRRSYKKGTMIFSQGDAGDALFGIASGKVRISASDDKGHEVFLNVLGPGETFGEIALLDGLQRTASAVAIEPSTLVVIPRAQFLEYLEREPGLSLELMKLLCERLRWVSDLVEEAVFLTGPARVAKRLKSLVDSYGRPAEGSGTELVISQAELGQFLGVSRQIINLYLRTWSGEGWVTLKRGRIVVNDADALSRVASQDDGTDR